MTMNYIQMCQVTVSECVYVNFHKDIRNWLLKILSMIS